MCTCERASTKKLEIPREKEKKNISSVSSFEKGLNKGDGHLVGDCG